MTSTPQTTAESIPTPNENITPPPISPDQKEVHFQNVQRLCGALAWRQDNRGFYGTEIKDMAEARAVYEALGTEMQLLQPAEQQILLPSVTKLFLKCAKYKLRMSDYKSNDDLHEMATVAEKCGVNLMEALRSSLAPEEKNEIASWITAWTIRHLDKIELEAKGEEGNPEIAGVTLLFQKLNGLKRLLGIDVKEVLAEGVTEFIFVLGVPSTFQMEVIKTALEIMEATPQKLEAIPHLAQKADAWEKDLSWKIATSYVPKRHIAMEFGELKRFAVEHGLLTEKTLRERVVKEIGENGKGALANEKMILGDFGGKEGVGQALLVQHLFGGSKAEDYNPLLEKLAEYGIEIGQAIIDALSRKIQVYMEQFSHQNDSFRVAEPERADRKKATERTFMQVEKLLAMLADESAKRATPDPTRQVFETLRNAILNKTENYDTLGSSWKEREKEKNKNIYGVGVAALVNLLGKFNIKLNLKELIQSAADKTSDTDKDAKYVAEAAQTLGIEIDVIGPNMAKLEKKLDKGREELRKPDGPRIDFSESFKMAIRYALNDSVDQQKLATILLDIVQEWLDATDFDTFPNELERMDYFLNNSLWYKKEQEVSSGRTFELDLNTALNAIYAKARINRKIDPLDFAAIIERRARRTMETKQEHT